MPNVLSDYYNINHIKSNAPSDAHHYFFGYYDMRATNIDGLHLTHRADFMDRIPEKDDFVQIGYLKDNCFFEIAKTSAWNFQQGAMLQFHPTDQNTIYYNAFEKNRFTTVTHNFITNEKRYTDMATACISPDGKFGLSVNFGRIFSFRAGYGYAGFNDNFSTVNQPLNDGIFLTNMLSGTSCLMIDYGRLGKVAGFDKNQKILINHVTFSPDSKRYVALVRNFPWPNQPWCTTMVVGDLLGNCHAVLKNTYVSHYKWVSADEILVHASIDKSKKSLFKINVDTCYYNEYDMPYFHIEGCNPDIHCSLSPDGKYIIGDGYNFNGYRALMAYSLKTKKERTLLKAKVCEKIPWGDFRCDLHARFIDENFISFDTTCNNRREIMVIPAYTLDF